MINKVTLQALILFAVLSMLIGGTIFGENFHELVLVMSIGAVLGGAMRGSWASICASRG